MRVRSSMLVSTMVALALFAVAQATTITHFRGVNSETSEPFEAAGTWAVTLAAYCYEGFGFVEARVFDEHREEIGLVTVMGEGIERLVLDTEPGTYTIEVYTSYWHVYNWEVLVEPGEGSDYAVGTDLLVVSHADHLAAQEEAAHLAAQQAAADAAQAEPDHAGHGAAAAPVSIWDGIFTAEQAQRGGRTFEMQCAVCHGSDLISADGYAPDLTGFMFTSRWYGQTVAERFERIQSTMPLGRPNTLSNEDVADILAYILDTNRFPRGEGELTAGGHLEGITIEPRE